MQAGCQLGHFTFLLMNNNQSNHLFCNGFAFTPLATVAKIASWLVYNDNVIILLL